MMSQVNSVNKVTRTPRLMAGVRSLPCRYHVRTGSGSIRRIPAPFSAEVKRLEHEVGLHLRLVPEFIMLGALLHSAVPSRHRV
jgi:hypothetical protein